MLPHLYDKGSIWKNINAVLRFNSREVNDVEYPLQA